MKRSRDEATSTTTTAERTRGRANRSTSNERQQHKASSGEMTVAAPTTSTADKKEKQRSNSLATTGTEITLSSPVPPSSTAATPNNILFVVGTYHSITAGLVLRQKKFFLKFSSKHHVGCVTCVALCDKYMASAGTDERLFLYTVKDRGGVISDLGSVAPASEVTSMAWHGSTHLLCGCADGTVAVYRSRDWESVFAVQVHERRVVDVLLLNPSGAAAVTLGADRHVAVLDMVAGKLVTKMKLPLAAGTPLKLLQLDSSLLPSSGSSSSGSGSACTAKRLLVVVCEFRLTLIDLANMEVLATADMERQPRYQIHSAVVAGGVGDIARADAVSAVSVVVGCEDGCLRYVKFGPASGNRSSAAFAELRVAEIPCELAASTSTARDPTKVKHPVAHAARVKALSCCVDSRLLVSADANGAMIAVVMPSQQLIDQRLASQSSDADNTAVVIGAAGASDAAETIRLVPKHAVPLDVAYFASANCQGRVTSLSMLRR